MADYTPYKRGSEWRKWNLHTHTPETKKNDQFTGSTPEEKWKNYVETINSSIEEIAVVGITDYFSIENYFKFKDLVSRGIITKVFGMIIPNIELRVLPATASATAINIHCIFNPAIDKEIESRFLSKLKFHHLGTNYSAAPAELVRLGRVLKNDSTLNETAAVKAGIEQYVIGYDTLREIFEKDPDLRDNTIIVVSNKSQDGPTGIVKHADFVLDTGSQLDATRQSIYQLADAIFSSNDGDRKYFIGKGVDKKEIVVKKYGSLKPAYHGCDAHSNDKVFKPAENRFCWIKADPTFEGLKQTVYEPEDRVKIQAMCPDVKIDRYLISELVFKDSGNLFGQQKILLNDNLNAIIGGKSSGKSLLLYSAAQSIDPDQVLKASKRLGFEGYKFNSAFDFDVVWKNGEVDTLNDHNPANKNHKITYIPQLYINYLVEKNNKEELNLLIKSILLQDDSYKSFFEETTGQIADISSKIESLLNNYLQTRLKGLELQQKVKDTGVSKSISQGIEKIQAAIEAGQRATNLTPTEFDDYKRLTDQKSVADAGFQNLIKKEGILLKLVTEIKNSEAQLFGQNASVNQLVLKGQIDRILDEFTDIPADVQSIRQTLQADYHAMILKLETEIANLNIATAKQIFQQDTARILEELKPILSKISGQQELEKLTKELEKEKQRLLLSENYEKQVTTILTDYKDIRSQIVNLLKQRYELYQLIATRINTTRQEIGSEVTLHCDLLFKGINLLLFDQANRAALTRDNIFNEIFIDQLVDYDQVLKLVSNPLRIIDDKLVISDTQNIPLKQKTSIDDLMRGLVIDGFELDYTVTYKGDNLLTMSPGKKGTVLLILFLQISSAEYPILIDQPEDNLDNRTIYDLLCQMIKLKKQERQIIIVSHNANLVVATDTENIIVANQQGQGSEIQPGSTRFEYVNGSLEHSFAKNNTIKDLLQQQGIKEHVCDILEGGGEAFKQRERKYAIKLT